jgi:predicted lactoylglutathione lyase
MKYIWVFVSLVFLFGGLSPESRSKDPIKGSGIVFFSTTKLEVMKNFYIERIGCEMWIDQGSCAILRYGNLLVGFCQSQKADLDTLITFFFEKKEDVDRIYKRFKSASSAPPKENKKYRIYHFYAKDPEGRSIEFQTFLHPIEWDFSAYNKD